MPEAVDTGFDAVADGAVWKEPVLSSVDGQPEPEVNPVVTATVTLPDMTQQQLAALAREIAMDIKTIENILATYKLTSAQYDHLKENNAFFKHALKTLTIEWQSAASTPERIKIEAAAALEDAMPVLYTRLVNKAEGLPGVTEVAKLFAKIAGVGERQEGPGTPGERFTITIDLGGDQKLVVGTKDVTPTSIGRCPPEQIPSDREGEALLSPRPSVTERESLPSPVLAITKGPREPPPL